jgi:hypothetical protein
MPSKQSGSKEEKTMPDKNEISALAEKLIRLSKAEAEQLLAAMAEMIRQQQPMAISSIKTVDSEAGLCLIYHPKINEIAYVGETGNLAERHDDLESTENHTFRRSLGNSILKTMAHFAPIHDTKSVFAPALEAELSKAILRHRAVFFPLHIGRKEVEETIVKTEKMKSRQTTFYNRRQKRA